MAAGGATGVSPSYLRLPSSLHATPCPLPSSSSRTRLPRRAPHPLLRSLSTTTPSLACAAAAPDSSSSSSNYRYPTPPVNLYSNSALLSEVDGGWDEVFDGMLMLLLSTRVLFPSEAR